MSTTATDPANSQSTVPKRSWFRYSLRTLLVVVTLVCLAMGWYVAHIRPQQEAVRAVLRLGGSVRYDNGFVCFHGQSYRELPWWDQLLGIDTLHFVTEVDCLNGRDWHKQVLPQLTDADLAAIGRCTSLRQLTFGGYEVTDAGIRSLTGLTQLKSLFIGWSVMTDQGLASLHDLRQLESLHLHLGQIQGKTFDELAGCTKLRQLSLVNSQKLTDEGLEAIAKIKSLRSLDLTGCTNISVLGIAALVELPNLEELRLDSCDQLTNHALAHLGLLANLKRLSVQRTWMDGYALSQLAQARQLESLDLAGCENVNGFGFDEGEYRQLKTLILTGCDISDESLSLLQSLKSLEELTLLECPNVSRAGLRQLAELPRLIRLEFSRDMALFPLRTSFQTEPTVLGGLTIVGHSVRDDDLEQFAQIERLERLYVTETQVNDAGIAHLCARPALPLREVLLQQTSVTQEGLDRLQDAFPNCRIYHSGLQVPKPRNPQGVQP